MLIRHITQKGRLEWTRVHPIYSSTVDIKRLVSSWIHTYIKEHV